MTPAYSYLRVSGKSQIDGDGRERQRQAVMQYARKNDFEIVAEYFDGGVSGTIDGFDRPQLKALFEAIVSSGVRHILIERSDRMARRLMVGEIIIEEFRKLEVKVIEVEGGTEITVLDNEPDKVFIRQIMGVIAQFSKSIDVKKMKAARDRIREAGGHAEGPLGFGLDPDKPAEKLVVNRVLELRAGNLTAIEIAAKLNDESHPTRLGKRWHPTSVKRILQRKV